jgi:hypothetical protein
MTLNFGAKRAAVKNVVGLASFAHALPTHPPDCSEAGLRFGVQMDRDGPGIVLLDYELITAEDASERAEGWKKLGIKYIELANWDEVGIAVWT